MNSNKTSKQVNQKPENLKKLTFSNTIWKFLERIAAQSISLIVSIILARMLTPSDYSVVSVVLIFFAFANVIISGGLNAALIQKKDADEEDYSTILHISLIVSVFCYVVLFFAAPFISKAYQNDILTIVIRIMGLILPVTAVKSIWCSYISAKLKFRKFFLATIVGTVVSAVIGIAMALKGYGCWALVAQQMINTFMDTVILVITTRIGIKFKINLHKFKTLFKYGWKILVSSLLGTLYTQISPLAIGIKFSPEDLAYYNKAQSFPSAISGSITQTLSAVLFPVLARVQDDIKKVLRYTRLFIRVSSTVVFPIMLGLFAVADNFILVLLTEKWASAAYYLRIFCVVSMFDVVAIGNCETIKAIGKSGVFLIMEIIKKSTYFITLLCFVFLADSPQILIISQIVCLIIQLTVNSYPNKKLINYSYKEQIFDIVPALVCSSAMAAVVYFVGVYSSSGPMLTLVKQIILGISLYLLFSYLFNKKTMDYIFSPIKKKLFGKH